MHEDNWQVPNYYLYVIEDHNPQNGSSPKFHVEARGRHYRKTGVTPPPSPVFPTHALSLSLSILKASPVSWIQIETLLLPHMCFPHFSLRIPKSPIKNTLEFPHYIETPFPNSNFQIQIHSSTMSQDLPSSSSSSSSSSVSNKFSSTWLKFFVKFRRILIQSRKPRKQLQFESKELQFESKIEEKEEEQGRREESEESGEIVMQKAVKKLLFGKSEEREMAALEIRRLAEEDVKIRKNLAELGVIPPLVKMVDSGENSRRRSAVQALLQLADGTFT